jgi:predicted 2-oxoglutarate/Fe(II)-dependent dioxygenase YbiX
VTQIPPPAIIIKEAFLSAEECAGIVQVAKTLTTWDARAEGYWKSRIAHVEQFVDSAVRDKLVEIRKRVRCEIVGAYQLTTPLYSDTLQIVRWPQGFEQQPHADAENPNGVPHPYSWRAFASLIYLNDDFEGGQIYFPNLGLAPTIKPGMLVFFPGTLEFLHGVRTITRGERFTLASFWTFDAARQDRLPVE